MQEADEEVDRNLEVLPADGESGWADASKMSTTCTCNGQPCKPKLFCLRILVERGNDATPKCREYASEMLFR